MPPSRTSGDPQPARGVSRRSVLVGMGAGAALFVAGPTLASAGGRDGAASFRATTSFDVTLPKRRWRGPRGMQRTVRG